MGSITLDDAISYANRLAEKCQMPQRVETIQEVNSDFVLLVYYAVMGELPKDIFTESKSRDAQVHNVDCIIKILSEDYLNINLSHISSKKFVQNDPSTIFNLLEILDGLLDFMLDYVHQEQLNADGQEVESSSSSGLPSNYQSYSKNNAPFDSHLSSVVISKEKIYDSADDSFHPLDEITTVSEVSSRDDQPVKMARSLKDISISSVEGEWKPSRKVRDSSLPEKPTKKIPAKKNLISRFESMGLDETFKVEASMEKRGNVRGKYSRNFSKDTDEYSTSSGGLDVCDGGGDGENKKDDDDVPTQDQSEKVSANVPATTCEETVPKSHPEETVPKSDPEEAVEKMQNDADNDRITETAEDNNPQEGAKESEGCANDTTDDHEPVVPEPSIGETPRSNRPPVKDWQTLMDNLQQTVEESRRIREKYYSSPMSKHSSSITSDEDDDPAAACKSSSSSTNEEVCPNRHCNARKVHFDDNVDVSNTPKRFDCDDVEMQRKFDDVLQREQYLQDIKNKLLECSYLNHLEDVNAAERKKLQPLREKAAKSEGKVRRAIAKEMGKAKSSGSGDHLSSVRKQLAAQAKRKSCHVPTVRNVPQRRLGVSVKKKDKPHLEIGEHDLLPTLLQEFPGLQLSKQVLDSAWRKQFRQIENLTKQQTSHEAKKRASNLKLQEAHNSHALLTDIMRREHEQTQRVRDARSREQHKRSAESRQKERRQQSARVRRYYNDYQLQMRSKMMRRRTREEKIFKHLFEEGLEIQKCRLRELRKYARDKRELMQNHQRNQIASLENYYRDQFQVLAENLQKEKEDLNVRDKAQTQLVRQMRSGLRKKMEKEIEDLQELIMRDDDDAHFREIEADRVRRQLQLATYHARFKPDSC